MYATYKYLTSTSESVFAREVYVEVYAAQHTSFTSDTDMVASNAHTLTLSHTYTQAYTAFYMQADASPCLLPQTEDGIILTYSTLIDNHSHSTSLASA